MKKWIFCLLLIGLALQLTAQGKFDVDAFTNPEKYGWKTWEDRMNYRYDLYERQKLLQLYEIDAQSISGNLLKSAVIPGWGQFNAKQYTKGEIFLSLEIGLLGTSYLLYDKALTNYNRYKEATQIDDINRLYHNAQEPYQYSIVFLTLGAIVWGYNLIDIVQTTEQYNAELWEKTVKNYYNAPVQITPTGFQIKF
ncbi:MAG TPA: hypothetical protein PKJ14_07585 [Candidatus Cloacimonadota bacterium]|nr:hypothetical protein [Candidatus Cloacimonadota bacterium]HQL15362.1 hypothetical protein [Candidatus Cloacimonadota bacterium]